MLFVLVLAIISSIVIASVSFTSRYTIRKSGDRRVRISAFNIAEAGKERFYAAVLHENLKILPNSTVNVYTNKQFTTTGKYSVSYNTKSNPDSMLVNASGVDGSGTTKLEVLAFKRRTIPLTGMAGRLPGAIMARGNVSLLGNITVDGNDHDSLGNLNGFAGTYGVYTCLAFELDKGSAQVGGNGQIPVDKKGIDAVRTIVCRENAPIPPELASPEAFLGVCDTCLNEFKVTPAQFNSSMKGLVYVTDGFHIQNFNNFHGILIVHNSTNTAKISVQQGTFTGLLIVDYMDKINGQAKIVGAVVTLSNSSASTFGNGKAEVLYSKQALNKLDEYCTNVKWKIDELSWREVQ